MTPMDFIEGLSRHYSKRFENAEKEAAWTREMVEMFRGTDPAVLRRAYELVRDEHDERAFPLPAHLKRFIARAADLVYPEHIAHQPFRAESHPAPDPESVQRVRALVAGMKAKIAGKHVQQEPAPLADVSRPAFEVMHRNSKNRALHMTAAGYLSDLSKRMAGDRE